jgi:hypothetical protein
LQVLLNFIKDVVRATGLEKEDGTASKQMALARVKQTHDGHPQKMWRTTLVQAGAPQLPSSGGGHHYALLES